MRPAGSGWCAFLQPLRGTRQRGRDPQLPTLRYSQPRSQPLLQQLRERLDQRSGRGGAFAASAAVTVRF